MTKNKRLRGYFIAGLLVVVPLYITVYVLALIVRVMDGVFTIMPAALQPDTYLPFHIPGLGIILTIAVVFVVGVLATNYLGRRLLAMGEVVVARVPVLRIVYNATKQFMETFFAKEHEGFRKVVLVEFPRTGVYSMGFMTSRASGEIRDKTHETSVSVFVPTTPNPTTGFFIIVKESEVIALDMKVEDAFKVIMTGGMALPAVSGPERGKGAVGRQ
jgi:uncharacterized membrane protein